MTVEIKSSQQKDRKLKLEFKYNKNQKDGKYEWKVMKLKTCEISNLKQEVEKEKNQGRELSMK